MQKKIKLQEASLAIWNMCNERHIQIGEAMNAICDARNLEFNVVHNYYYRTFRRNPAFFLHHHLMICLKEKLRLITGVLFLNKVQYVLFSTHSSIRFDITKLGRPKRRTHKTYRPNRRQKLRTAKCLCFRCDTKPSLKNSKAKNI